MSLLHIDITQVLKILPQVRPGPTYSTLSISWLLMSWRRKEPGHQQPWYWPSWTDVTLRVNTLRRRQNGRHFADNIFSCIFMNKNVWILIKISLKFVLKGSINNIPALVQIMVWRWPGVMPLSELMMVSLATHIGLNNLKYGGVRTSLMTPILSVTDSFSGV